MPRCLSPSALHSACCRCGRSSNKERVDDLVGSAPPPCSDNGARAILVLHHVHCATSARFRISTLQLGVQEVKHDRHATSTVSVSVLKC